MRIAYFDCPSGIGGDMTLGALGSLDLPGVERLAVSPMPTGTGRITITHGECNISAPARAERAEP
jgi:uncharacterized protein (DUF111 family)